MTKVIVVGDRLVASKTLEEAAYQMNLGDSIQVERFEWYSDLTKE